MSRIRIQSKGEGRWYVAYLRYLADQRESKPVANHVHYGNIPRSREAALRSDARRLAADLGTIAPLAEQTRRPRPRIRSK